MRYINAERLEAEIEKHIKEVKDAADRFTLNMEFVDANLSGIYDAMSIVDSLLQEQPEVNLKQENTTNMEQKELTAQEIVEKLIDEKKISGKEAVILLNAVNKPAEVRIEKEYTPYIPNTTPWYLSLDSGTPKCYEPGGTCANPNMDCINCPKFHKNGTYTAATRAIPTTMKEE